MAGFVNAEDASDDASGSRIGARERSWSPITAFQLEYSLLEPTAEGAFLLMCDAHGIGVIPWSPLKNGRLSASTNAIGPRPRTPGDMRWPPGRPRLNGV